MAYKSPAASNLITGVARFDSKDVLVTAGLVQKKCGFQPGPHNLGITYAAGVLAVCGSSQVALSATNPGYITMQSKTAGKLITVPLIANQDFIDGSGASQIVGNMFGMPGGAYASDIPFYLYAILKEDESAVAIACSRIPNITLSPAVAKLGRPSTATADTQGSMFIFEDVTLTDYDLNPVHLIGSFRMQMSVGNDWTVSALNFSFDGIGRYQESNVFEIPLGAFGASANAHFKANGGTAPVFTTNHHRYYIYPSGNVYHEFFFDGDGGTDGAGAVYAYMCPPIVPAQSAALEPSGLAYYYTVASVNAAIVGVFYDGGGAVGWSFITTAGTGILNSFFINGARFLYGNLTYRCSVA